MNYSLIVLGLLSGSLTFLFGFFSAKKIFKPTKKEFEYMLICTECSGVYWTEGATLDKEGQHKNALCCPFCGCQTHKVERYWTNRE